MEISPIKMVRQAEMRKKTLGVGGGLDFSAHLEVLTLNIIDLGICLWCVSLILLNQL